jgi:hypothetical protein
MQRRVVWYTLTDVSDEFAVSIIMAINHDSDYKMLRPRKLPSSVTIYVLPSNQDQVLQVYKKLNIYY